MKVKEIMNKAVVVEDNISLRQAIKIMSEKAIGSLIIIKKDKIAGIITERDILKNVGKIDRRITEAISKNVIIIEENETLDDAARIMSPSFLYSMI